MATPSRPTELLLDRIATTLGVPVEAFTAPQAALRAGDSSSAQIAALLFDPDGQRLAASFVALPPQFRRSLADIAEAILASSPSKDAA